MAEYDDFILYGGIQEDIEKRDELTFGSEEWKRVNDSIDKRYNTIVSEARLGNEIDEKEKRLEFERLRFEHDVEIKSQEMSERQERLELERSRFKQDVEFRSREMDERQERLEFEKHKFDRDSEIREKEIEQADRKSKREFIGKVAGIIAGIGIVGAKLIYDNSEALTDKFTLDAGSKMISGK